ncbi:MAG TPA: hypothetical protein VK876_13270 [Rubrivivax sp.]|nr:hypothetical protein [Rubrivivax sp.]
MLAINRVEVEGEGRCPRLASHEVAPAFMDGDKVPLRDGGPTLDR